MPKYSYVGKTIKDIIQSSCNIWEIVFTDGTSVLIEADCFGIGNGLTLAELKFVENENNF